MDKKLSVALVGAGSMGGALLRGWLSAEIIDAAASSVFEPSADDSLKLLARKHGFHLNPEPADMRADIVVLAVKPQAAASALPAYAVMASRAIIISIMAGLSLETIARHLDNPTRIVRAMPNLPASIGEGVTGLYSLGLGDAERENVDALMAAAGETVWVQNEQAIDFVTAVSGSGPAYFFLLTEALEEAAVKIGLGKDAAQRLARATASGAGALLASDARAPADMRKAVTSPGGTTAAALAVLDGDKKALRELLKNAVVAAAKRAGELTQ